MLKNINTVNTKHITIKKKKKKDILWLTEGQSQVGPTAWCQPDTLQDSRYHDPGYSAARKMSNAAEAS